MRKENYSWLQKELPLWLKEGLVTEENAALLLRRYADKKGEGHASSMALSLVGFVLVGLGIISILAYNWAELGHLARTLLAIGILVSSQAFAFWVKRYQAHNKPLLEGSGVLWFLMMGASLAIIGQTYHLGGTLPDFLCGWLFLSFLIVWVLPSSGAAFLQIILWTVVWVSNHEKFGVMIDSTMKAFMAPWVLLMMASLYVAYYVWQLKKAHDNNGTVLLSWAMAISLMAIFVIELAVETYELRRLENITTFLALFFALYYMAGNLFLSHGEKMWQRPFVFIGKIGVLILLLSHLSFRSWRWMNHMGYDPEGVISVSNFMISLVVLFVLFLILFIRKYKSVPSEVLIILSPFVFFVYNTLMQREDASIYEAVIFINISFLLGASLMILRGAQESSMGMINQGMLLIAIGIWIHFMDADFSLVAKGLAFIATGIFFLAMNALVRRKLKAHS
ncbi:MAG: DUF2157 domain-containing protein [Campylobacterales bacterium]|nr:DUF2157 domain-containing protein [Campylobacterales bacterium]MBN2832623.1 DUF2157 domain-containing protein [Campylobacterales bacterium]